MARYYNVTYMDCVSVLFYMFSTGDDKFAFTFRAQNGHSGEVNKQALRGTTFSDLLCLSLCNITLTCDQNFNE